MEKVEQINKWSSDDQSGSSQTKSYTCTFCKRGFSNAQALGGHMNIHRRDRARIRQQYLLSEEEKNQVSNLEAMNNKISTSSSSSSSTIDPDIALDQEKKKASFRLEKLSELQQIDHITKAAGPFCESNLKGKVGIICNDEVVQQLPLFANKEQEPEPEPETTSNIIEAQKVGDFGGQSVENVTEELDLELRLGPNSSHTSLTLSTREFF